MIVAAGSVVDYIVSPRDPSPRRSRALRLDAKGDDLRGLQQHLSSYHDLHHEAPRSAVLRFRLRSNNHIICSHQPRHIWRPLQCDIRDWYRVRRLLARLVHQERRYQCYITISYHSTEERGGGQPVIALQLPLSPRMGNSEYD